MPASPSGRGGARSGGRGAGGGEGENAASATAPGAGRRSKLGYQEQREYDGIEETLARAETAVNEAVAEASDPSTPPTRARLIELLALVDQRRAEVDRLYARWAELEAKRSLICDITPPMAMTTTPSGLQYEDTQAGTGAERPAGQTCVMHYTGWLWTTATRARSSTARTIAADRSRSRSAAARSSRAGTRASPG